MLTAWQTVFSTGLLVLLPSATTGTATYSQNKLHISAVALWVMVAGFVLSLLSTIGLTFIAPVNVVPKDPSTIGVSGTILARSIDLNRRLRYQGTPNDSNHRSALVGYEFGTAIATSELGDQSFKIVTSEGAARETVEPITNTLEWWTPATLSYPVLCLTAILPIIVLITLEMLQRKSDQHRGLMDLSHTRASEAYIHFIPALIMLLVAGLINALDFNVALFAPWTALSEGNAVAKSSILSTVLGHSPPVALFEIIKGRYVAAFLSLFAAAMASVLTIVVCGLYTIGVYPLAGQIIPVTRLDAFNLGREYRVFNDNGAASTLNMIEFFNMSYPSFTYSELAFPQFRVHANDSTDFILSKVVGPTTMKVPALRGNLRCDIVAAGSFNVTSQKSGPHTKYAADQALVAARVNLPESCQRGGFFMNESSFIYVNTFPLLPDGQSTYGGAMLDLRFGANASLYGSYGEDYASYVGDNPPVGCPSLAFTFGNFRLNSTDKSTVTTTVCYQQIQRIDANITLLGNTMELDPYHPPIPNESTAVHTKNPNSTIGAESFDFRIQANLAAGMKASEGQPVDGSLDVFFEAVLDGSEPHQPADLIGVENEQKLLRAINRLYRKYMAQAINANMRQLVGSDDRLGIRQSTAISSLETLTTSVSQARLVQHSSSKLALQVLLGIMTVCAIAAFLTTKMRKVLPCNPCTIAGIMSLLAGSDLCHSKEDSLCECCGRPRRISWRHLPESIHVDHGDEADERESVIITGAEWMDAKTFARVFQGKRYSMGWWRARPGTGKRRRFGVDVGARPDGKDDEDWELGQRRPRGNSGFGDFMMSGAVGGRGDRDGSGMYRNIGEHSPNPGRNGRGSGGEA